MSDRLQWVHYSISYRTWKRVLIKYHFITLSIGVVMELGAEINKNISILYGNHYMS